MDPDETTSLFDEESSRILPPSLNVLTILTFIGCAISYMGIIVSLLSWSDYDSRIADMQDIEQSSSDNGILATILSGSVEALQKSYEYRYLLVLSTLVCTTFCLLGALQMRRLKLNGYVMYLVGEITPLIISLTLFGTTFFTTLPVLFPALVALLFIYLYSTQRRRLLDL